jgi:hypothetical protein
VIGDEAGPYAKLGAIEFELPHAAGCLPFAAQ